MKRDDKVVILAWVLLFIVAATVAFRLMRRDAGQGFGGFAYGGVPYFELQGLDGEARSLHQMKGKVWLLHFVSPQRREPDMATLEALRAVRDRYAGRGNFQIVSVSADLRPLEQIRAGMDEPQAGNWFLLHGPVEDVSALMRDGFRLNEPEDLFHLDRMLFLIDQNATIRGYYMIDSARQVPAIERHLQSLL